MEADRISLGVRALTILATIVLAVAAQNALLVAAFPDLLRLPSDFSTTYFERDLRLATAPPQTVFLGDSVLWGYRLRPDQTAVALLRANGCACRNLALKGGSPANFYVIARLMELARVRPARVVLEVNQKSLNKLDPSYKTLHPSLAVLAAPFLSADDRARFATVPPNDGPAAWFDRAFSRLSTLYAMRADVRSVLFGDDDGRAAPAPSTDPEDYLGMYDMRPLDEHNAGVRYLAKTLDTFRSDRIPVIAFLTPTDHKLLHEFVDQPQYAANGAYLRRLLARHGATVLDLDAAFPPEEFFDNAHLRTSGQHRLAATLARAIGEAAPRAEATTSGAARSRN